MTSKPDTSKPGTRKQIQQSQLRAKAEAKLVRVRPSKAPARPAEELLHKLQVQQIELEMQNEALRQSQIALEESRDHYIGFYDFAPVGYLTLTNKGLISEINLTGAALLGMERNRLLRQPLARFVAPGDSARWRRHFPGVLNSDEKLTCELAFRHGDGSGFDAQLDCLRLANEGKAPVVHIVLTDITARKQIEEVVSEQKEFFRTIAENIDDFIAVLDLEGRRIYNSPSYSRFFDNIEAMKGTDSFADIHPDDRERVRHVFRETVQSGVGLRTEFRFVLGDGSIRHMESRGALIRNSKSQASRVVVVSRDITVRKLAEEEIHKLAFYDSLTGLPNRRLLEDRLSQSMAASKRSGRYCALIFVDLDNFKPLNDKYGHAAGDLLLEEVAHRISSCVREVDTVARFGGDEFVALFNGLDVDKARSIAEAGIVAEKIRLAVAEPYVLTIQQSGKAKTTVEHYCSSSLGVVMFIDHEINRNDIITYADLAMYQAKQDGRNIIRFFDPNAQIKRG